MRRRSGLADNAVTVEVGSQLPAHGVFSQPSSDDSYGSHDNVKDGTEDNSRVDPTQDVTDRHPSFVNPKQTSWKNRAGNQKTCSDHQGPPSRIRGSENDRPKTDESEDATYGESERTQLLIGEFAWHRLFRSEIQAEVEIKN